MSMKSGLRHIFSGILVIALAITLSVPALATDLKSFSDVPSDFWAHDAIMDMVSRGMFAGTKAPDANGVGEFNPNGTMTRAQFITVITRYLYADKLAGMAKAEGDPWYANNYIVAVQEGLIKKSDFSMDGSVMNQGMSREEMAYVLVRAMEVMGESSGSTVSNSRIPDYNKIGTAYRSHVKIAYTKGLIVGTDAAGTFNPKGTLNRAQAATVIYRLIAPETRKPVDPNGGGITVSPDDGVNKGQVATGTTWVEGEKHDYTAVKAGATVVRADGTKVVLKETKVGNIYILGYGQGVDFVTGTVRNGNVRTADKLGGAWSGFNGNDLTAFKKDPISGEVHTEFEWDVISLETVPHRKGSYDGEKANTYFEWDSAIEEWLWTGPSK